MLTVIYITGYLGLPGAAAPGIGLVLGLLPFSEIVHFLGLLRL